MWLHQFTSTSSDEGSRFSTSLLRRLLFSIFCCCCNRSSECKVVPFIVILTVTDFAQNGYYGDICQIFHFFISSTFTDGNCHVRGTVPFPPYIYSVACGLVCIYFVLWIAIHCCHVLCRQRCLLFSSQVWPTAVPPSWLMCRFSMCPLFSEPPDFLASQERFQAAFVLRDFPGIFLYSPLS